MKNWKTTLSGFIGAAGILFPMFGLPAEIGNAVATVGLFLIGIFAKDSSVSGTGL